MKWSAKNDCNSWMSTRYMKCQVANWSTHTTRDRSPHTRQMSTCVESTWTIGSGMQWSWPNSYSSTVFHCSFTFLKASCHWLYILTSFMPLTSWAWALNQFNQSYSVLIILLTCIKTWFPTIPYRQIFMLLDYQMTNCKHVRHLKTIVIMSDERLPSNLWSKFLSYKLITSTLNLKCWLPNLISKIELRI